MVSGRVVLGFVVAPAVVPIVTTALSRPSEIAFLSLPLFVSYGCSLLFGIPGFLFFRRLGWLTWWQVTLGGIACVTPLLLLYVVLSSPLNIQLYGLHNGSVLAGCSAVTALAFWVTAIWRNPSLRVNPVSN